MVVHTGFEETTAIFRQPVPAISDRLATFSRRLDYFNALKPLRVIVMVAPLAIRKGASIKRLADQTLFLVVPVERPTI